MKKNLLSALALITVVAAVILYAYRGIRGKVDIEFRIHINEQLVRETVYGESPTFAIWLEDPATGKSKTIFVTRRAAAGDWEGKAEVPVALPLWFEIYKEETRSANLPTYDHPAPIAITGATPQPGYFTTRVRVDAGSSWICRIEMNLSGDYNEFYLQYDPEKKVEDAYGSGQPALVYMAKLKAVEGTTVIPQIEGMSVPGAPGRHILQPVKGITTAKDIFDEISIAVVKPKPKILD